MGQPEEDFVPTAPLSPEERDPEAPTVDVVEQATVADPNRDEAEMHRGLEVADWDAIEQSQMVGPADEDDYR
ncbi:MAG TPA: hypothetical protein VFX60_19545 [Micromonospora sp.]|nr:hypothetical protein [Micromonospora sp.]